MLIDAKTTKKRDVEEMKEEGNRRKKLRKKKPA
jgi:hypothetical protein